MVEIHSCEKFANLGDEPKYQRTFATPLRELTSFVPVITSPFAASDSIVKLELIVFEPHNLISFLKGHGIEKTEGELHKQCISATADIASDLLVATLSDWIDFWFLPASNDYRVFADHDEYTTIYCDDAQKLAAISASIKNGGFQEIEGWLRS